MFSTAIIAGFVLVAIAGSSVDSYTIGRGQEYSSGNYNPSSFVSLKDPQDQVSTNYAASISPRYSSVYGPSSSYSEGAQSSGYGGHASANPPEALNTLTASYQSDSGSDHSSYSSPQTVEYSSSAHNPAAGTVSFSGYAGSQGGTQDLGVEYASPSSSSSAYSSAPLSGYSAAKAAAYSSSVNHPSSQSSSSYPSTSSYVAGHSSSSSAGHSSYPAYATSYPGGRHPGSSYPAEHPQSSFSDGHRFSPSTLKSFMSSLHRESPGGYHSSGPSHSSNYIHSALPSSSYSKSPGPFLGGGGFPKGAGKIIIIKDGSGAHTLMHPESSYPSGMFSGGSGYKVRSAGPFSSGHHYGSPSASYSHSPSYSGTSGHPNTAASGTSYFGYS